MIGSTWIDSVDLQIEMYTGELDIYIMCVSYLPTQSLTNFINYKLNAGEQNKRIGRTGIESVYIQIDENTDFGTMS